LALVLVGTAVGAYPVLRWWPAVLPIYVALTVASAAVLLLSPVRRPVVIAYVVAAFLALCASSPANPTTFYGSEPEVSAAVAPESLSWLYGLAAVLTIYIGLRIVIAKI
jgi:hypothetical protein